jgi:hypothetical protein
MNGLISCLDILCGTEVGYTTVSGRLISSEVPNRKVEWFANIWHTSPIMKTYIKLLHNSRDPHSS